MSRAGRTASPNREKLGLSSSPSPSRSCCHCSGVIRSCDSHHSSHRVASQSSHKSSKMDVSNSSASLYLGHKSSRGSVNSLPSNPRLETYSTSSSERLSDLLSAQDSKEAFILEFALPKISHTQKALRRARARVNEALAMSASNTQTGVAGTGGAAGSAGAAAAQGTGGATPNGDNSDDERRGATDGRVSRRSTLRSLPEPENLSEVKGAEEVESWLEKLGRAHGPHDASKSDPTADDECLAYARLLNTERRSASQDACVKTYPCAWQSARASKSGARRGRGGSAGRRRWRRWTDGTREDDSFSYEDVDGGRWRRHAAPPRLWIRVRLARSRVRGIAPVRVQRLRDRYTSHTLKTCMDALARVLKQPTEKAEVMQKCRQIALLSGPPDIDGRLSVQVQVPPTVASGKSAVDGVGVDGGGADGNCNCNGNCNCLCKAERLITSLLSGLRPAPEGELQNTVPKPVLCDRREQSLKPMVCAPADQQQSEPKEFEATMTSYGDGDSHAKSLPSREIVNALLSMTRDASVPKTPSVDGQITQKTERARASGQNTINNNTSNNNTGPAKGKIQKRRPSLFNVEKNAATTPEKKKVAPKTPAKNVPEVQKRQQMTKYTLSHPLPDLSLCRPKVDTGLRRPLNVSINDSRKKLAAKAVPKTETKISTEKVVIKDKKIPKVKVDGTDKQNSSSFPVYRFEKARTSSPSSSDPIDLALGTEFKSKSCAGLQREGSMFSKSPLPQILEAPDDEDGSEHDTRCLKSAPETFMDIDQYDRCTPPLQSSISTSVSGSENSSSGVTEESSGGEKMEKEQRIRGKETEVSMEHLKTINIRIPLPLDDPSKCVGSEDDVSVVEPTKSFMTNLLVSETKDILKSEELRAKLACIATSDTEAEVAEENTKSLKIIKEAIPPRKELNVSAKDRLSAITKENNPEETSTTRSLSPKSNNDGSIRHDSGDASFSKSTSSDKSLSDVPASEFVSGETIWRTASDKDSTEGETSTTTIDKALKLSLPHTDSFGHLVANDCEQWKSTVGGKEAGDQKKSDFASTSIESTEGRVCEKLFMKYEIPCSYSKISASPSAPNLGQLFAKNTSPIMGVTTKKTGFGPRFIKGGLLRPNSCRAPSSKQNTGEWIRKTLKDLSIPSRSVDPGGKKSLIIDPYSVDPPIRLRGAGSGGVVLDNIEFNYHSQLLVTNDSKKTFSPDDQKLQSQPKNPCLSKQFHTSSGASGAEEKKRGNSPIAISPSRNDMKSPATCAKHQTTHPHMPKVKVSRGKSCKVSVSNLPRCLELTIPIESSPNEDPSVVKVLRLNLKDPASLKVDFERPSSSAVTTRSSTSLESGIGMGTASESAADEGDDEISPLTKGDHGLSSPNTRSTPTEGNIFKRKYELRDEDEDSHPSSSSCSLSALVEAVNLMEKRLVVVSRKSSPTSIFPVTSDESDMENENPKGHEAAESRSRVRHHSRTQRTSRAQSSDSGDSWGSAASSKMSTTMSMVTAKSSSSWTLVSSSSVTLGKGGARRDRWRSCSSGMSSGVSRRLALRQRYRSPYSRQRRLFSTESGQKASKMFSVLAMAALLMTGLYATSEDYSP